ncbi:MAG TPA: hypothetical protein VMR31_02420 [Myxococcota bacterium]|nr:hypothetical protein [Myxococcota bacterium]
MRPRLLSLPAICLWIAFSTLGGPARAGDLAKLDLTGEWYVLVHYKNAKSEDKSISDWKDLGWSMVQTGDSLTVQEFPYVMFDEGTEEVRRADMRGHKPWQPEGAVLDNLKAHMDVSSRAKTDKKLTGSVAAGMKSEAAGPAKSGTVSFSRNWTVTWAPDKVRIQIVDALGGGNSMLGEMSEAAIYDVTAEPAEGELTGTFTEGDKSGSLRMIRAKERRVVK